MKLAGIGCALVGHTDPWCCTRCGYVDPWAHFVAELRRRWLAMSDVERSRVMEAIRSSGVTVADAAAALRSLSRVSSPIRYAVEVDDRGRRSIRCGTCGMRSHSERDVDARWCGNCCRFYDDRSAG